MAFDEPFPIVRGFLTELMTDKEIDSMNDSIECYLNGSKKYADEILADEIGQGLWKPIIIYREMLEAYYLQEGFN